MLAATRKRLEDSITAFPEAGWTEEELTYLYIYTGELLELHANLEERRMSTQYLHLFREAGQVIPLEVLKVITEKNDSAVGVATVKDGQVVIERLVGAADAEALHEAMSSADAKDCKQLYVFVKSSNTILEEDIPPFACLHNNNTVLACVGVEGTISAHDKPKSSHSAAFHFVNDVVVNKVTKLFKGNDSDLDKFCLDSDTDDALLNICPDNGSMFFLFANDHSQGFTSSDDRVQQFPWGLAYGEPPTGNGKAEPEIAAEPKVESVVSKPLSGLRAAAKPPVTIASTTPISQPEKKEEDKKDDADGKKGNMVLPLKNGGNGRMLPKDKEVWEAPPQNLNSKDALDRWYNARLGYRPSNWKDRPWAPKLNQTLGLSDLKTSTTIPPSAVKDTTTKNISVPPPMLISANLVQVLKESVLPKILGVNSEIITNPGKVSGDEMATPSAASQLNKTGIEDFCYPHAARCMLIEGATVESGRVQLVSRIWGDFINSYVSQKKKIEDLEAKLAKVSTEEKPMAGTSVIAAPVGKPISGLRVRSK